SGIIGFGFASISAYNHYQLMISEPLFSFYLERYINKANQVLHPAMRSLGGTNSSLYKGPIDSEYLNLTGPPSYWLLVVSCKHRYSVMFSVCGLAAIDTGTTFIRAITTRIWAQISGSTELTGDWQGLYASPCDPNVAAHIYFGGTNWAISPLDVDLSTFNDTMIGNANTTSLIYAGGIFDIGISSTPAWIVGDTFLKNVYSVFRASPVAVGFPQLANGLSSSTGSSDSNPVQVTSLTPLPTSTCASLSGSGNSISRSTSPGSASPNKNIAASFTLLVSGRMLHLLPLSRAHVH
ncbi:aspartic peptidase domain-containing protein, partial [Suillus lakei]